MKKILSAILAVTSAFSLFSCGKEEPEYLVDGNMSPSTDIYKVGGYDCIQTDYNETVSAEYAAECIGVSQDLPYTDITGLEHFMMYFEDFRDPDNPLQLSTGTFDDAVIISPVRYAYFNGGDYVNCMSSWIFPVAHENQFIGIIWMSDEVDERGVPLGSSSQSYSAELNKALEHGKIALFRVGNCHDSFAIAEDGTVFNLSGEVAYKGNLTFEEVDKGYNIISEDSFSTAVYPVV